MNYLAYTNRILVHYWHHCILCLFLILLGVFGCGGDNEETSDDQDPSKDLVGTWELITVGGKTFQPEMVDEETEFTRRGGKACLCLRWLLVSGGIVYDTDTHRIVTESNLPQNAYTRDNKRELCCFRFNG